MGSIPRRCSSAVRFAPGALPVDGCGAGGVVSGAQCGCACATVRRLAWFARHDGGDRVRGTEPEGRAHRRVWPQPLRRDPGAYEGAPAEAVALLPGSSWAKKPCCRCSPAARLAAHRAARGGVAAGAADGLPLCAASVEAGQLSLHGWHYVIEDGEVHVFDAEQGAFVPSSVASHSGTGPYQPYVEHDGQVIEGV